MVFLERLANVFWSHFASSALVDQTILRRFLGRRGLFEANVHATF